MCWPCVGSVRALRLLPLRLQPPLRLSRYKATGNTCIPRRATCCPSVRFYLCRQHIGLYWSILEYMTNCWKTVQNVHTVLILCLRQHPYHRGGVADIITRHTPHKLQGNTRWGCLNDVCSTQDRIRSFQGILLEYLQHSPIRRN